MENKFELNDVIEEVIISEEEIKKRVKELAKKISEDYKGRDLCFLSVLSGSWIFAADLVREMEIPVQIRFIFAASYEGTESTGKVDVITGKEFDPEGRNIVIIEDIVDTGRTLTAVKELLLDAGAKSVEICTFLDKPERRVVELVPKYIGFKIPNKFAVGYGLDYNFEYRQFPFVGVLKKEIYEEKA